MRDEIFYTTLPVNVMLLIQNYVGTLKIVAVVGYLHSEGTEWWESLYNTSTHCYDIDTKLNQHSKNGGSGGTSSFWGNWKMWFLILYNTTSTHCCNIDANQNQRSKNGGSRGISSFWWNWEMGFFYTTILVHRGGCPRWFVLVSQFM